MEKIIKDMILFFDIITNTKVPLRNTFGIQYKDFMDKGIRENEISTLANTLKLKGIVKDYMMAKQKDGQYILCIKYLDEQKLGIFKRELERKYG